MKKKLMLRIELIYENEMNQIQFKRVMKFTS